jgi:hypothetical protein
MQKLFPEGSKELADTYSNLITIYFHLRDKVAVTVLIEKEMNILTKFYGENHPRVLKKRQHYKTILSQLSTWSSSNTSPTTTTTPTTTSSSTTTSHLASSPKKIRTLSVPTPKYNQ